MISTKATKTEVLHSPKYYEMDGARVANANRAWLLAFLATAIAFVSLAFAMEVRLKPPTVIRIGANGEASVLGEAAKSVALKGGNDEYLSKAFVRRFLAAYLNYGPANVDDHWASALNQMTRNLRGMTIKAMTDNNVRGKVDDEQIQSIFHLREIDTVPGEPLTFLVYGVKDVHHVTNGTEVTDHFVNEYRIRLVADRRSETNPDGLWIADYSERPLDGERRNAILATPDRVGEDE